MHALPAGTVVRNQTSSIDGVSTLVETARQEWADGHRRLEAERANPPRYRVLHAQVDAITERLRRRLGAVYTLSELAAEYRGSERWVHDAIAGLPGPAQRPAGLATATDAAFHLYARGAQDYEP
jgi:hypothetical protein